MKHLKQKSSLSASTIYSSSQCQSHTSEEGSIGNSSGEEAFTAREKKAHSPVGKFDFTEDLGPNTENQRILLRRLNKESKNPLLPPSSEPSVKDTQSQRVFGAPKGILSESGVPYKDAVPPRNPVKPGSGCCTVS